MAAIVSDAPRVRCAKCLSVIHHNCHFICSRVALCHVIMCALHPHVFETCIRSLSMLSVSTSDTLTCTRYTFQILFSEREKNVLETGRDLSSGLGISPADRLSNPVPFGGCLMPQRLTALTAKPFLFTAQHTFIAAQ